MYVEKIAKWTKSANKSLLLKTYVRTVQERIIFLVASDLTTI